MCSASCAGFIEARSAGLSELFGAPPPLLFEGLPAPPLALDAVIIAEKSLFAVRNLFSASIAILVFPTPGKPEIISKSLLAKMVSEIYRSEWSNFELGNRRPIGRSENFHLVFQMNTDKTYLLRWE